MSQVPMPSDRPSRVRADLTEFEHFVCVEDLRGDYGCRIDYQQMFGESKYVRCDGDDGMMQLHGVWRLLRRSYESPGEESRMPIGSSPVDKLRRSASVCLRLRVAQSRLRRPRGERRHPASEGKGRRGHQRVAKVGALMLCCCSSLKRRVLTSEATVDCSSARSEEAQGHRRWCVRRRGERQKPSPWCGGELQRHQLLRYINRRLWRRYQHDGVGGSRLGRVLLSSSRKCRQAGRKQATIDKV